MLCQTDVATLLDSRRAGRVHEPILRDSGCVLGIRVQKSKTGGTFFQEGPPRCFLLWKRIRITWHRGFDSVDPPHAPCRLSGQMRKYFPALVQKKLD